MKKFITFLLTVTMAFGSMSLFTACKKTDPVAALICLHGEGSS